MIKRFLTAFVLFVASAVSAATTTSITQDGVTFTFADAEEYGQFADGYSYWVVGPVTVNSVSPAWDGTHNGSEINPTASSSQGFTTLGTAGYSAAKRTTYPVTINGPASLVHVIGGSDVDKSYVRRAVVLTVLTNTPPDNGASVFRPPYVGTDKPLYSVSSIRWDLLPSYTPTASAPALATVTDRFSRGLRMDHHTTKPRSTRPTLTMQAYNPKNTEQVNEAMLRLMGDDSIEARTPAMIAFTQHAIDRLYAVMGGYRRQDNGHNPNHRVVAAWAAVLLDIEAGKAYLTTASNFHEDRYLYQGVDGRVLWGEPSTELQYWDYLARDNGGRSNKDPYSHIDGGRLSSVGASYQNITSQSLKGQALVYRLFPQLRATVIDSRIANLDAYAERWVETGVWATPDPAAPYDGNWDNYGITFGPNGSGSYIAGAGRSPHHGANTDGGQYKSAFVASMWDAYSGSEPPVGAPTLSSAAVGTDGQTITLTWSESVSTGTGWTGSNITLNSTSAGNNHPLTLSSGSGTATWVMTTGGSVYVYNTGTPTLSYNGVADAIESGGGTDVAAIVNRSVTNNSDVPPPPAGPSPGAGVGRASGLMFLP